MTTTTTSGAADLRTAAQAVVDRWDTPLWKDVPATAEYIGRLRAALAAGQATAAQAVVPANLRLCYSCGHPADAHPWVNDPRGGKRRGDCPAAPAQPAAQQGVAYAVLPEYGINTASHAHFRVLGFTADQMRAFADATCALRASHGQAPAATTFCWATELSMVREPVTLTAKEAREVSDQMQRLHAASFKTELRNLTSIDLDGDQAVRLAFMSCRAASAFKRAVEAVWPTI